MAASKQASILHTHFCNAVMLVWGSLRFTPIILRPQLLRLLKHFLPANRTGHGTSSSTCKLDVDMKQRSWDSYFSGTTGKTEENILLKVWPKSASEVISDYLVLKISLGEGGGHAPRPPYLLHAYVHSNCRILFADQMLKRKTKECKVQDSSLGLLNSG